MRARPSRGLFALLCALPLAACVDSPAPPARQPQPNRPLFRVLAGEKADASAPAAKPKGAPAAPAMDREFVRRLALTKNFQYGSPVRATPTPDGKSVLFLRSGPRDKRQALFELDVAKGKSRELLTPDAVAKGPETLSAEEHARRERMRITQTGFTAFEISKDGARVLVTLSGRLYLLTRATGAVKELPTGEGAAIDPHLSPDGKRVAYVRGADVYAIGVDDAKELAVTRGGTPTRTHGVAEFVAQEELDRYRGFFFSPDGTKIVYEEADTSKVDALVVPDLAHPEQEPERPRYPRPGRPNADVRFGVTGANGGATVWLTWDRVKFPYVATVTWEKGGPLALYVLDRAQQNGVLLAADPATGKTEPLVTEHDDVWLNVDGSVPRFLPDGRFLWSTEKGGEWALELRGAKGEPVATVLPKGYRELIDVDAARGRVTAMTGDEPSAARVESVDLKGGDRKLVIELPDGTIGASFGEGHDLYVAKASWRNAPPRWYANDPEGKTSVPIPSVAEDPGMVPRPQIATVGPDGTRVAIIRPQTFDKTRRYPVLDSAYGGPHHAVVVASSSTYLRDQWIADATDAIVVAIDAKGTPNRTRAWERALRDKIGDVPLEGHVAAIEALGRAFPEMDVSRVGIYGWSFGGYLAALAALERPDVYKVAVVGAPVVDWRDYDSCYTERYLGMPDANKAAYDAASLLSHTTPKPGQPMRPMLVIHGTADDNVYFTNTLKLVDALERAAHPFELVPLVGITHMPYEPAMYEALWVKAAEFLRAGLAR